MRVEEYSAMDGGFSHCRERTFVNVHTHTDNATMASLIFVINIRAFLELAFDFCIFVFVGFRRSWMRMKRMTLMHLPMVWHLLTD